jgi:hypothetical protein
VRTRCRTVSKDPEDHHHDILGHILLEIVTERDKEHRRYMDAQIERMIEVFMSSIAQSSQPTNSAMLQSTEGELTAAILQVLNSKSFHLSISISIFT